MKYSFLYLVILLSLICKGFSQDIIIKTDSSKIEAKILEVRATEIKYKIFNFQDGPLYVVSKNDIAYVVYANGVKEIFETPKIIDTTPITPYISKDTIFTNATPPKGSENAHQAKVGDYIKFNLQVGAMMNSLSANYTRREPPLSHTSFEEYSSVSDKNVYNLNFGFNFLFGKNQYIKHVVGANYLRSTGEYNYSFGSAAGSDGLGGYKSYSEDYQYISKIDFINVVTGLRFTILNKLCIEPLLSVNIITQSDIRCNGYNTTKYITGGPVQSVYKEETEYVSNKKVGAERAGINSTISLCPRISYEFKIKQQKLGAYFSYNLAYQYRLPWYMAGITYYPFKKLSPSLENKKIKLFPKIKLNGEIGITLNNSLTNLPTTNNWDYRANNKNILVGSNFGINIISGENKYCKHVIGTSIVQSKTDFSRSYYMREFNDNKLFVVRKKESYQSENYFLNISTGIRFILFKCLNIDNSIVFNFPFYSNNKINGTESTEEFTLGSNNYYNNRINYAENSFQKNSTEILTRASIGFSPKISFDFKIKEQKLGLFFNFNYAFQQKFQWHMLGLSYYPFKKLR